MRMYYYYPPFQDKKTEFLFLMFLWIISSFIAVLISKPPPILFGSWLGKVSVSHTETTSDPHPHLSPVSTATKATSSSNVFEVHPPPPSPASHPGTHLSSPILASLGAPRCGTIRDLASEPRTAQPIIAEELTPHGPNIVQWKMETGR